MFVGAALRGRPCLADLCDGRPRRAAATIKNEGLLIRHLPRRSNVDQHRREQRRGIAPRRL